MKIIKNPYKNHKSSWGKPEKIEKVNQDQDKDSSRKLVKIPETGLWALRGPKITKEMVERDFPTDCCRGAIILRRSVGL